VHTSGNLERPSQRSPRNWVASQLGHVEKSLVKLRKKLTIGWSGGEKDAWRIGGLQEARQEGERRIVFTAVKAGGNQGLVKHQGAVPRMPTVPNMAVGGVWTIKG